MSHLHSYESLLSSLTYQNGTVEFKKECSNTSCDETDNELFTFEEIATTGKSHHYKFSRDKFPCCNSRYTPPRTPDISYHGNYVRVVFECPECQNRIKEIFVSESRGPL